MNSPNRPAAPAVADGGDLGATSADLGPQTEVGDALGKVPHSALGQIGEAASGAVNVHEVLYLTDMDSEALCLQHLHQE
ncbi:hypothetical protein Hamer_G002694 [Homarus americanus]|uniref:Uncharacterized protein n=1 Tax=Homarus americanus TaxID=6706 RepID=A0A8J5JWH7_HOMAM|nr:hypothetical protein Hamer_G002694 [Homarus americanus]